MYEIQVADRELQTITRRHQVRRNDSAATQLPFFMACIKETLRRGSPAQTILPRLVSHPGYDLDGGQVHVPSGTLMGASAYIVHRNEAVFGPDPGKWRPERWIQDESGMGPREHQEYVKGDGEVRHAVGLWRPRVYWKVLRASGNADALRGVAQAVRYLGTESDDWPATVTSEVGSRDVLGPAAHIQGSTGVSFLIVFHEEETK